MSERPARDRYDVVVLGGAIAGASAALILRRENPDLSVLVVEKSRQFDLKVGEATTEMSGMFFTRRLGLWQHLELDHLPKEGLRYWFANEKVERHDQASETGGFVRSLVPSFQLRRDRLDQHVLDLAVEAGAELLRPAHAEKISVGSFDHEIEISTSTEKGAPTSRVRCRWLVDATGRACVLGRKLGLIERNERHPIAALWCRWRDVAHVDDVAALSKEGSAWAARNVSSRRLATNHYSGRGYWVWYIPLGHGETSIGIVWDKRYVKLHERTDRKEAYVEFLRQLRPANELMAKAEMRDDDFRYYSTLAYATKQYAGDGWALVGDAAAFIDPYYSPGLDHVGFSVEATTQLILDDAAGRLASGRIREHNEIFLRSYWRFFDSIFEGKYRYMGEADLLSAAMLLDTAQYYIFVVIPAYRFFKRYQWMPVLGPKEAFFAYHFLRLYHRRFQKLAELRLAMGEAGRRNDGRRIKAFFDLGLAPWRMAARGVRLWLAAELDAVRLTVKRLLGLRPERGIERGSGRTPSAHPSGAPPAGTVSSPPIRAPAAAQRNAEPRMTAPDPRVGELLDRRYRLLRRLGSGGAGSVYLARHEEMDRLVAVKLLHSDLFPNPAAFARFRREARAAGSLRHPNVVLVHDFGRSDEGEPYLVMEYCDGGSLADRLTAGGAFAVGDALRILEGAASAIDTAHSTGVVHRDLKPANLLFVGGEVKVADFGLAKIVREEDAAVTGTNALGSPLYMSPEQCQGLPTTPASDVYSFGVIAYELLAGEPPFTGPTIQALLVAHLTQPPPPLGRWIPNFPDAAEEVFRGALDKQPAVRFESAGAFVAALASALAGAEGLEPVKRSARPRSDRSAAATRERSTLALEPIGRRAELEELEALAEEAAAGAGRLVTLAGEPGTGKSTLAAAFLARIRARHPRALAALGRASEQFASAEPYSPFLDALGHLVREAAARDRVVAPLAAIAPSWAAHLPELASTGAVRDELLEGRRSRDRMPREFQALIEELAARQLVLLVFEDLHWADAASIDLLARLAPRLSGQAILIVATYRPADVEIERHPLRSLLSTLAQGTLPWTELSPAPFGEEEVTSFLRRELGAQPPPELVGFALRRSEGNPLFLLNVLNHLLQSGAVERSGSAIVLRRSLSSIDHTLPEGIAAVLRQKAERLDEEDRRLPKAASVEGEQFSAALVARMVSGDEAEIEERLRDLAVRHRLIEPAGEVEYPDGTPSHRFRFAHSLYQHAFYDDLAPKRREALHRKAGEELERLFAPRPQAALVPMAVHFEKGREFRRAIEKHLAAAALSGWRNPKDARPHLAKALELARKLPDADPEVRAERASLLIKLGKHDAETAEFLGDVALYGRAEEAISEALLLEPGSLEARTTLGLVHLERGENERAFIDFTRVLERSAEHAGAWDGLSYLFKNTGFWTAALACQQRAAAADPAFQHSIRRLSVLIYLDRFADALADAEALVLRRPYFAHYNYWRGIAAFYAGKRSEARHWIEQAFSLDPDDPIAQGVYAFALAVDGEADRARAVLASAEPGAAADGTFTYWIAKVHALLGESAEAIEWLRRAAARGYWDAPWMRKDPVLRRLDAAPAFGAAVDEIDARRAQFARFLDVEAPAAVRELLRDGSNGER